MADVQSFVNNYVTGMQGATKKYTDGVSRVTQSPTQKAAQHADKMLANLQASVSSGRYANACNKTTLQSWQQSAIGKASRLGQGAASARDKVTNFASKFLPQLSQIQSQVQGMPSNTYEDNMSRQRAFADSLHALKGSFS